MARISKEVVAKRESYLNEFFKNTPTATVEQANTELTSKFGSKMRPGRVYEIKAEATGQTIVKRKPGRPKKVDTKPVVVEVKVVGPELKAVIEAKPEPVVEVKPEPKAEEKPVKAKSKAKKVKTEKKTETPDPIHPVTISAQ